MRLAIVSRSRTGGRVAAAVDAISDAQSHGPNLEQKRNVLSRTSDESEPCCCVKAKSNDVHRLSGAGRCDQEVAIGRPVETATARRALGAGIPLLDLPIE